MSPSYLRTDRSVIKQPIVFAAKTKGPDKHLPCEPSNRLSDTHASAKVAS